LIVVINSESDFRLSIGRKLKIMRREAILKLE